MKPVSNLENKDLGVNFTNILHAAFLHVSFGSTFLCLRFRFVLYWCKTVGAKAASRTLMKLSPGFPKEFEMQRNLLVFFVEGEIIYFPILSERIYFFLELFFIIQSKR
jgi:hypothetical protein